MRFIHAVLAMCLLLAAPVDNLVAASASKEFPNDECPEAPGASTANIPDSMVGAEGSVGGKLKWKKFPGTGTPTSLDPPSTTYSGCEPGGQVAADILKRLCTECFDMGAACTVAGTSDSFACPASDSCSGADCCTESCIIPGAAATLRFTSLTGGRITLQKPAGIGIIASDLAPGPGVPENLTSTLTNFQANTSAGNTVATDLLPKFVVTVERRPGAVDGPVTVKIDRGQPQPEIISIPNTTGMSDLNILQALQAGFTGRSIASTIVRDKALLEVTAASESYYASALSVNLPANVLKVSVKAPRGFINQTDTSAIVGPPASTPALSTWGVAALVGLMLLAGAWILRRTTTLNMSPR